MTFVSWFAGIGGIDLGLERAGHVCVGQIEIDEFCRQVLAMHWPDVPRWGDLRTLDPRELPHADLWAGGFPCQDISNAGRREGIDGERSGLFFDWMRLIRLVRPRHILMENVAALLGRGMDRVLGELAESGYDAEWDVIPAGAVGAPHIRERVFILANAQGHLRGTSGDDRPVTPDGGGSLLADAAGERRVARRAEREGFFRAASLEQYRGSVRQWAIEPDVGRVAHGVPRRVDRLRALGNAVVPQVAEYIGRMLTP